MLRQIGQFLLFIGLISLVIFFATDQAQNPACGFLLGGAALCLFGLFLMFRRRSSPPADSRFRTLRRVREKRTKRSRD